MTDWRTSGAGPFRIRHKPLDYAAATRQAPFLTGGWIPLHGMTDGLEPGDLSKFMSVPWQTDYNSCSIHQPSINTSGENTATGNPTTLYWSWPVAATRRRLPGDAGRERRAAGAGLVDPRARAR